ncbi:MAG: tRNA pseudouridine(38-40) synthase TruA [candidate division Zixibacteria bacterium]|nr:tRNA pseudouridine(38-40) synthase TruA [candidate division Zixibacteria bacterium]
MRTLALTLEYDGTDFLGWQIQASGRTVQAVLETALSILLREKVRTIAAGRTDAGVHALGQVAHFSTASSMSCYRLLRGLSGLLPPDVAVYAAQEIQATFHARYSAIERRYRYRILRRPGALQRRYVWQIRYPLDIAPMRRACAVLVGNHDFVSFCQTGSGEENTICDVHTLIWSEVEDELFLDISANRFLHHMVRTLVGTAVEIGRGRWTPEKMQEILEGKDRCLAGPTAPAAGLCLMRVVYPAKYGIR